jgi:hypothetical protein
MPGHATSPVGAPCAPSFVCTSIGTAMVTGGTPPVGAVAIPEPLSLSMALADPWCTDRRVRVICGAIRSVIPRPVALQREYSSQLRARFALNKRVKKILTHIGATGRRHFRAGPPDPGCASSACGRFGPFLCSEGLNGAGRSVFIGSEGVSSPT